MAKRPHKRQPRAPDDPRAALGEAFLIALLADWHEGGPGAIGQMRADKPADYVKLVAALAPKESRSEPLYELTDAEIAERIAGLLAQVGDDRRESQAAGPPAGIRATEDGGAG